VLCSAVKRGIATTIAMSFMHLHRQRPSTVFLLWLLTLGGCSTQAWYESAKISAENQCRQQPPSAIDACMAQVNKTRYDTYEKERATAK
jgi:hypothetical protein